MKILVSEKLSEHKYKTPEGYLICTDAILARTGKQTYTKDEVFGDGDNTEIDIDRPYDQVMNEKTIASFENKPVTFDHPEEDVNVGNYKSYAVGYVRDVHQGKVDGKDVILGNLVITDQDAINSIESGEHTDLSCGYDCDIKDDGNGGYAQNNIRGNHVALCKEGRAGMARIVDSKARDLVNDSKELVVGKWYDFAKKIEVARNQYATSLRISGKSGNVYRYTIYLKNGEMHGSGTYSEIKERFNIKDSKVDSKTHAFSRISDSYVIEELPEDETVDDYIPTLKKYNLKIQKLSGNKVKVIGNRNDIIRYYDKEIGIDEDDIGIEDSKVVDQKVKDAEWSNDWANLDDLGIDDRDKKAVEAYFKKLASKYGVSYVRTTYGMYPCPIFRGDKKRLEKLIYNEYAGKDRSFAEEEYELIEDSIKDNAVHDSKEMTMSDAIKMLNIVDSYKKVKDAITWSEYEKEANKIIDDIIRYAKSIDKQAKVVRKDIKKEGAHTYTFFVISIKTIKYRELESFIKSKYSTNKFDSRPIYGIYPGYVNEALEVYYMSSYKKKIKDASKDEWVIKNTGLAYEIWNQGRMIKKFPAKKLAIEWIHSRFPTDKIVED